MPKTPSVPELAQSARTCQALEHAAILAEWVGAGRTVTPKGMLKPSDIPAACAQLGIALRSTPQRLSYLPDLHVPWLAALKSGLVHAEGTQAVAAGNSRQFKGSDDEQVLELWLATLVATVTGAPDDREQRQLTRLMLAAADRVRPGEGLDEWRHALIHQAHDDSAASIASPYRLVHRLLDDAESALERMVMFRAIERFRLQPLGAWALQRLTPPTVRATASAAELLRTAVGIEASDAYELCRPWLTARESARAASELFAAAAHMDAGRRRLALDLASSLDDTTLPAWEEAAKDPALGPAARLQLWDWNLLEYLESDDALLLHIEELALALAHGDDADLLDQFHTLDGRDPEAKLERIAESRHPDGRAVCARLRELGAPQRPQRLYQLKITLKGWGSRRRVLLSPATSLAELHEIIRILFDWDDDHLHLFVGSVRSYADPSYDLDADDEYDSTLSRALPQIGSILKYTYDLGDCWEHEVTLQKILDAAPDTSHPLCAAGHGDNPVEDSWAEDGSAYPTTPFDLDAVNRRLSALKDGQLKP